MTVTFFALIFTSSLLLATAPPSPSPPGCTDKLVAFSPCLGYVSAPPNNITDTATSQCCDAFAKSLDSGGVNCFCYLIKQPLIFGFPLNGSRIASLPSVCSSALNSSSAMTLGSLNSVCLGSPALPPLGSTTTTSDSGPDNVPTPSTGLPLESPEISPTPLNLPPESVGSTPALTSPLTPDRHSSASKHSSWFVLNNSNSWFLPGVLTSLVSFSHLQCHAYDMLPSWQY